MKTIGFFCCLLTISKMALAYCPDGTMPSQYNEKICCKNGWAYTDQMKKYDYFTPYCGCPDGGTFTLSKKMAPLCCKNHFAYNDYKKSYSDIVALDCGCPYGGIPGKNHTCCKNNYAYNDETQAYDYLNPEECGCPNGGTINIGAGVNEGNVCCKNGYAHKYYFGADPVIYDEIDATKCGCPDGATPSPTEKTKCCKGGFIVGEKHLSSVQAHICGCPDGGEITEDDRCIKNGFLWNDKDQKYNIMSSQYGCGLESIEMGGICCKNEYAYNNNSGEFDLINGRCGCPQGSKHSSWGPSLLQLNQDEKLSMIMSICCKNEQMYNPVTNEFDRDNVFCTPVPNDLKEVSKELFAIDLIFLREIFKEVH